MKDSIQHLSELAIDLFRQDLIGRKLAESPYHRLGVNSMKDGEDWRVQVIGCEKPIEEKKSRCCDDLSGPRTVVVASMEKHSISGSYELIIDRESILALMGQSLAD